MHSRSMSLCWALGHSHVAFTEPFTAITRGLLNPTLLNVVSCAIAPRRPTILIVVYRTIAPRPTILIVVSCAIAPRSTVLIFVSHTEAICWHQPRPTLLIVVSCTIALSQIFWLLHLVPRPFTAVVLGAGAFPFCSRWGHLLPSQAGHSQPFVAIAPGHSHFAHAMPFTAIALGAGALKFAYHAEAMQCHCGNAIPLIALSPLMPLCWCCWSHSHHLQPFGASVFDYLANNVLADCKHTSWHFGFTLCNIIIKRNLS